MPNPRSFGLRRGGDAFAAKAQPSPHIPKRWRVFATCGLLHGFGFAGALGEVGLPRGHTPLALLFFNLGVEAGQLLFILTALISVSVVRFWSAPRRRRYRSALHDASALSSAW